MIISVYTDGSCNNDIGVGSYGYVITAKFKGENYMKKYSSGKYRDTTNNRMELKAIIKALENIDGGHTIDIYSDSKYCVDGINQWLDNWIAKNKLSSKMNAGVWERFRRVRQSHKDRGTTLNVTWVRGHNGNEFNEMADKLANVGRLDINDGGVSCKKNN